jgi:hypothetical protein
MRSFFDKFGKLHVFVSYASEHKAIAERVALSLRSRGYVVFFDKDDLPPGASYDDRIQRAIESCSAFVFLISPEALAAGRYTLTELKFARDRWPNPSKFVLPVMVAKTELADVPEYLKAVTILEPHGNVAAEVGAAVSRLTKAINRAVATAVVCVAVVLAAGALLVWPRQGSVDIGLTLYKSGVPPAAHALPTGAEEAPAALTTTYTETLDKNVPRIGYRLPYIEQMRNGGPINGIRYRQTPFRWGFPELSIKLANNTRRNVVLSSAIVKVLESVVDQEPVIVFDDQSMNVIQIVNEGWGEVTDPVLEFTVKDAKAGGDMELFAPQLHKVTLASFLDRATPLRINSYLPTRLRSAEMIAVSGTLNYGETSRRKSVKFRTTVLNDIKAAQGMPPSFKYQASFFEAGKAPATLVVPVSQTIKPGDADHFVMVLGTDKTSSSKLAISFKTTSGDVLTGGEFILDVFVPRSRPPI